MINGQQLNSDTSGPGIAHVLRLEIVAMVSAAWRQVLGDG